MKKVLIIGIVLMLMMISVCFADMETYNITSSDTIYIKLGSTIGLINDVDDVVRCSNSDNGLHRFRVDNGETEIQGSISYEVVDIVENVYHIKGINLGLSLFKFSYTTSDGKNGSKSIRIIVNMDGKESARLPYISNEDVDWLNNFLDTINDPRPRERYHYDENGNEIPETPTNAETITVELSQKGNIITASHEVKNGTFDHYDYLWTDISVQNAIIQGNFEHLTDSNIIPLPEEPGRYYLTVVGVTKSGVRSEEANCRVTIEEAATPTPSASPSPSASVVPTTSPSPSASANPTTSPSPSAFVNPTTSPSPSSSVITTTSPSPSSLPEPTSSPVPSATVAPTASLMPSATITPTVEPTEAPTPTPNQEPTSTPTPVPTPSQGENLTPGETAELPFIDVYKEDEFYEAIKYVYNNDIFKGMEIDYFGQMESMTRGMMVTVLYRLDGATESDYATFIDVPSTMYYSQPIAWANKNGIVIGIGDNKYDPERALSRQDLATIISRYINFKGMNIANISETVILSDESDVADYAVAPVRTAIQKGIMMTNDYACFEPVRPGTRAEIAYAMMILGKARK